MKKNQWAKLWQITMEKAGETERLYVVSVQKPMLVFESSFGRLRRRFDIAPSRKEVPPTFYLLDGEKAEVERATVMHDFKLEAVTKKYITLEAENPGNKDLYEISFFTSRLAGSWRKKYVFSEDKKEAASFARQFKKNYHVSVKKATKIDAYAIEAIEKDRIILRSQL